jgi:hypothetical protein
MVRIAPNGTFKQQAKKLIPATFKKAIITAIYLNNYTVDIYFIGNNQTVIRNIAVATNVDITTIAQGDRCKIDLFDEKNPSDMVMSYVYGKPQQKKTSSGQALVSHTGSTIPHGLGRVPVFVSVIPNALGSWYETASADATNLYLTYSAVSGSLSVNWYVM